MGTGIGLVFVSTATIVTYFKRQRGLTIGIAIGGGSFGGLFFPASAFLPKLSFLEFSSLTSFTVLR